MHGFAEAHDRARGSGSIAEEAIDLSARPTDVDIETARTVDLEAHGLLIEGQPQSGVGLTQGKGLKRRDSVLKNLRVWTICSLLSLGVIASLLTLSVLLAPDWWGICIFTNICQEGALMAEPCTAGTKDLDCMETLAQATCQSLVFDKSGLCCKSGVLDVCGVCDGEGRYTDIYGGCCARSIDAEGKCCQEVVDAWGTCTTVSTRQRAVTFFATLDPSDLNRFVQAVSNVTGIKEANITTVANITSEESITSPSRRLQSDTCSHQSDQNCSLVVGAFQSPSSTDIRQIQFVIFLESVYETAATDWNSTLSRINQGLNQIADCFCEMRDFKISEAETYSLCGNGVCEEGEVCKHGNTAACCLGDCRIIQYQCPRTNLSKDCSGRGTCDYSTGSCICWGNFAGSACERCTDGYSLHPIFEICLPVISGPLKEPAPEPVIEASLPQVEPIDSPEAVEEPTPTPSPYDDIFSEDEIPIHEPLPELSHPDLPPESTAVPIEDLELEVAPEEAPFIEPEALTELNVPIPSSIVEEESTELYSPPFGWREVGRLAQDLTFEKGPATSFALVFDPLDNTPYLAFTDADDPAKKSRPTLLYLSGAHWEVVGIRAKMVFHIFKTDFYYGNVNFAIKRSNETHPKTIWTSSFSRRDNTCLLRYYNRETGLWANYVTSLESTEDVPCKTPGNIFIDAHEGVDESDESAYVLYSSWEDQERTTVVYKMRLSDNEQVDLEFPVYLDPSRFIEFKRSPYDGKIYIMARLRSDTEGALVGNEAYPNLYCLEDGEWADLTRPTAGNENSYVYFYAMAFQPDGEILVAYILRSDTQTIHLMTCNTLTKEWTDKDSIHGTDLPDYEVYEGFFLDGMKFATDSKGNLYLYFKTFRHVESWPDNSFTATLWIYSFNKRNANSRKVEHVLDGIYGAFTSIQDDFLNDRSLGHLVFDNTDVPYYAFCKEAYWMDWSDRSPDVDSRIYLDQPNRCAPSVYRYWRW